MVSPVPMHYGFRKGLPTFFIKEAIYNTLCRNWQPPASLFATIRNTTHFSNTCFSLIVFPNLVAVNCLQLNEKKIATRY